MRHQAYSFILKLSFLFSMFALNVYAENFSSTIHSLDLDLIYFSNGRVVHYSHESHANLQINENVQVEVNDSNQLINLRKTLPSIPRSLENKDGFNTLSPIYSSTRQPYNPSIVSNKINADKIFSRSASNYKRISECSDRAHVWAYDEFLLSGQLSQKIFIFFTDSYIRKFNFKWWFHVAPLYKVQTDVGIEDYVMDFRYSSSPQLIKEWTDLFVHTKRSCKLTDKFSEYDVNPQTENCYIMVESMHYRLPSEIFDQEKKGLFKIGTHPNEIINARKMAFEFQHQD